MRINWSLVVSVALGVFIAACVVLLLFPSVFAPRTVEAQQPKPDAGGEKQIGFGQAPAARIV